MLNLELMVKTQKIMWIKRYLNEPNHPWKRYLHSLLSPIGGNYILNGNVDRRSLRHLPPFYQELLTTYDTYISDTYLAQEKFKPCQSIWSNKLIQVRKKPIYFPNLVRYKPNKRHIHHRKSGNTME